MPKKPPSDTQFLTVNNLECKISVNDYRMFFIAESEDMFYRKRGSNDQRKGRINVVYDRSKQWKKWLDR